MNNIKNLYHILKKLNYILNPKQKLESVKILGMVIVASFLELLGVSLVLPFAKALTAPESLMANEIICKVCDVLKFDAPNSILIIMGIALIITYILKNIFMILAYYMQYDYSSKVSMELSLKMLNSYLKRPYVYYLDVNSSEIMRGCTNDTEGVYNILFNFIQLMSESLTVGIISIYIIYTDWMIAVATIVLLFAVMLVMVVGFKPVFKRCGRRFLEIYARKNKLIYQMTNGIKELYVLQRKDLFLEDYKKCINEERKISRKKETLNSAPDRITEGICVSGIIGIIVVRLIVQGGIGDDIIPKLAVFAMAAFKILPSVGKITTRLNSIVYQTPALDNVYSNMVEADRFDRENQQIQVAQDKNDDCVIFENYIEVKNVNWRYNLADSDTLNGASLKINKGESVGLIGASGAGKTTLSDIILGLLRPQHGTVFMDDIDIFSIPNQWAKIVGYVPQSVFLIDDTVRANVLFGLESESDDEIWNALERAQLKTFVESLPDGLDTVVGERGVKFSGGQRQRIAIARALYSKPQVLVLDEATAALDVDTENAVMEAVESLQGSVTMIIVAHRLTTIRKCDKVFEIKNGKAVECEIN